MRRWQHFISGYWWPKISRFTKYRNIIVALKTSFKKICQINCEITVLLNNIYPPGLTQSFLCHFTVCNSAGPHLSPRVLEFFRNIFSALRHSHHGHKLSGILSFIGLTLLLNEYQKIPDLAFPILSAGCFLRIG